MRWIPPSRSSHGPEAPEPYRFGMTRRSPKGEIAILRRIHLFERLYADMKENEPYSQVGSTSITFTIGGPAEGITTDVNRQELRSYLLAFRQLISGDNPVFLPRLLRLLVRHVDDAELRERLGRALDAWKAAQGFPS